MAKIAIQMDPIEKIDIQADTTFALALEAFKRGHTLFYYNPKNLSFYNGAVTALGNKIINLKKEKNNHVKLGKIKKIDLSSQDIVLLRQDPPFDMSYITNTHILENLHPKTMVVNNPKEVRNAPEKILVNQFTSLIPDTLITRDINEIMKFKKEFKEIILKPLYGNGGKQIFHIKKDDPNLETHLEICLLYTSPSPRD